MRIFLYYIIGIVIGLLIALGVWRVWPDDPVVETVDTIQPQEPAPVHDLQHHSDGIESTRRNAITTASRDISPAVVGINVISVRDYIVRHPFFDDPFFRGMFPNQVYRQKVENLGSGFLISEDGYVLTNEHVVHSATEIIVTTNDGEQHKAELIGFDFDLDVALLKLDGTGFPFVPFGNSEEVIIGEWAIALGNPFGLFSINAQPSVTVGVVSATDRDFDRNEDGRLYQDMVQTDASINRGNSGGPLVNANGELIGMNTMIFTSWERGGSIGLSFAIPSTKLKRLYSELRNRGSVDRDYWIGMSVQNVNRVIAMSLRLPEVSGVVVTDVEDGSPAKKAGIEATDVIFGINGQKISDSGQVSSILRNSDLRVGDHLKVSVFREGKIEQVYILLGKKRN